MNKEKGDFFLHSNRVNNIGEKHYGKIELLVNAAKAFARSTYQGVYIIDYFHQDFIYASDNIAYLCGLEPEQLMEAGYQMYIDHVPDADLQMLLEVNKKGLIFSMNCLWAGASTIPSRTTFISPMAVKAD